MLGSKICPPTGNVEQAARTSGRNNQLIFRNIMNPPRESNDWNSPPRRMQLLYQHAQYAPLPLITTPTVIKIIFRSNQME